MTTEATTTTTTTTPANTTADTSTTAVKPADTLLAGDPNQKIADTSKPADDPSKASDKNKDSGQKPVVPDKYEFKFADGIQVDNVALEAFSPVMKELGLTLEQAQKLADVYAGQVGRQSTDFAKQLETENFALEQASLMLNGQRDNWAKAIKNDKEIGGANFDGNVKVMQRAMARFGTPELKELLNTTGLGNHPALAKFFLSVGQQIKEDNPSYGTTSGGRKSNQEVFYGASGAAGA